jgi:hypothetical protein
MRQEIWIAVINGFILILTQIAIYLLISKRLEKFRKKILIDVNRTDPSHKPIFEENRQYLRLLREINNEFMELYFNNPRRALYVIEYIFDKTLKLTIPEENLTFINEDVLFWFKVFFENYPPFYSVYSAHLNIENISDFEMLTRERVKIFFDGIPLIHPEIKKESNLLIDMIIGFDRSEEMIKFRNSLDNTQKTNDELMKLFEDFAHITSKRADAILDNLERIFLRQYSVISSKKDT